MKIITIKNGYAEIGNTKIDLKDIAIHFNSDYMGIIRADALLQQLRDFNKIPNKYSLARKLSKYKKIEKKNN